MEIDSVTSGRDAGDGKATIFVQLTLFSFHMLDITSWLFCYNTISLLIDRRNRSVEVLFQLMMMKKKRKKYKKRA